MPETGQMVHILVLLDDPSERVRASVKAVLIAYGDGLDEVLEDVGATPEQRDAVATIIKEAPTEPLFEIGQLVRHKRYGYRGVIVAVDETCRASDDWYQQNKTQPEREQPWYHVLADGSDQVYYPAQTSLEADQSGDEIENPLVEEFFSEFEEGSYVRNETPWSE